jgi:hypothetical protein
MRQPGQGDMLLQGFPRKMASWIPAQEPAGMTKVFILFTVHVPGDSNFYHLHH